MNKEKTFWDVIFSLMYISTILIISLSIKDINEKIEIQDIQISELSDQVTYIGKVLESEQNKNTRYQKIIDNSLIVCGAK